MQPERILYVCRLYKPEYRATARTCTDCGQLVAVSDAVYAERCRGVARDFPGARAEIVCDGCAAAWSEGSGADLLIAVLPSAEEVAAARAVERQ